MSSSDNTLLKDFCMQVTPLRLYACALALRPLNIRFWLFTAYVSTGLNNKGRGDGAQGSCARSLISPFRRKTFTVVTALIQRECLIPARYLVIMPPDFLLVASSQHCQ